MRLLGFSTGALAFADFRRALDLLGQTDAMAVELSALRFDELSPLIDALAELDLRRFSFISVHAPSGVAAKDERYVVERLQAVAQRNWPIVVHPDSIHDDALWRPFGKLMCIENMDKRKPIGRTRDELLSWFNRFPEASLCMDLAHARQIDPSMTEAYLILRDLGCRLAEIHLSEVNAASKHEPLSYGATLAYQRMADLIPDHIPIILESVLGVDSVDVIKRELQAAERSLSVIDPLNHKRPSGEFAAIRTHV
jgi:hypothetical protein